MKQVIGIIYLTINLVNGMGYVGFHHTSADDGYFGSGKIIKRAIKKNGKENFRRIILDHYCTEEKRTNKEIYWIDKLDLLNKKIGYNINKGGYGGDNLYNNPNKDEIYKQISKKLTGRFKGKNSPYFGKSRSEEIKVKCRKNNPDCKKVCIKGIYFQSISDASRKIGIKRTTLRQRLHSINFKEYIICE